MSYIGRGIDSIDNISTLDNLSFNGSDATFNLTQNSVAFVPVSADALQIQIDGVIQSGNYTVSGSTVTFDFTPSGSSVCNGIRHYGVGIITQPSDGSVNMAQLGASGTKDATTFLRGDNTFATVSGTTINNNADNRVITGSGTANTLNGEANLTYDGSTLTVKPGSNVHQLKLEQNNATDYWSLHADSSGGPLSFQRFTGGAETEKVRINSNGTTSIGNTGSAASSFSDTGDVGVYLSPTSSTGASTFAMSGDQPLTINRSDDNNDNSTLVGLRRRNEVCGTIKGTNNTAQYNTSSDYRLKENVNYDFDATTRLKQLRPARFNFIADADTTVDGFLAHEVSSVVPEAISGTHNEVDDDGNPIYQGIDQSKLVPLLVKTIQELEARITTLENA